MAASCNVYAFDCGTTNWRLCRLTCQETLENGSTRQLQPVSEPQAVALSTFTTAGHYLPATRLLDSNGKVQSYGQNAYELAPKPRKEKSMLVGSFLGSPVDPLILRPSFQTGS